MISLRRLRRRRIGSKLIEILVGTTRNGFYYQQLKRYCALFDTEHIRVCLYEDFN